MHETLILQKPVVYGSTVADVLFVALALVHALLGAAAVIAGAIALAAAKGKRRHVRAGSVFARAMVATALTGIVLDGVRLTVAFAANHGKYAGSGMPSSIPARLGFLYAALAVLYLVHLGGRRDFIRRARTEVGLGDRLIPAALLILGVATFAVVIVRLNPWTGALWMVATFMAAVAVTMNLRVRAGAEREAAVAIHRWTMLVLFAFAIWGAMQGFGPALQFVIQGPDMSTTAYVGDQRGHGFSPGFFGFLGIWAPPFVGAGILWGRYSGRS